MIDNHAIIDFFFIMRAVRVSCATINLSPKQVITTVD